MQSSSGVGLDNGYFKVMGYFVFPALVVLVTVAALKYDELSLLLCNVILVPAAGIHFILAKLLSPSKEETAKIEDAFLRKMRNLGYFEVTDTKFEVVMVGRYRNDPVAIRIGRSNYVIVSVDIEGIPCRYSCYSVGENDKYLLIDDGYPEVFRLFVKR